MNFTPNFTLKEMDYAKAKDLVNEVLRNGDINMKSYPRVTKLQKQNIMIPFMHACEKLVAVAPVLPTLYTLKVPIEILSYAFIIPVMVLSLTFIMHLIKVVDDEWDAFNVIQLLLGVSQITKSSQ